MDVSVARLEQLKTKFYNFYRQGYDTTDPWYTRLAMNVPSSSAQNDYGWMAALPKMKEWLGPRAIESLQTYSYQVKNKTFVETVGIKREHIEDDNLGIYDAIFQEFGRSAKKHPDELTLPLLTNGENNPCYDGHNFFDTSHPVNMGNPTILTQGGSATQSNFLTGTALTQANFMTARAKMIGFVDEGGRPLGVVPDTLVCGPALEPIARKILTADLISEAIGSNAGAAVSNVTKGQCGILMLPEMSGGALDSMWFLACTSRAVKPLVFQPRRDDAFVPRTAVTDWNVFMFNEYLYGVDNRRNVGYGLWWLMMKCTA